jgi:hypothetical protein
MTARPVLHRFLTQVSASLFAFNPFVHLSSLICLLVNAPPLRNPCFTHRCFNPLPQALDWYRTAPVRALIAVPMVMELRFSIQGVFDDLQWETGDGIPALQSRINPLFVGHRKK